MTKSFSDEFKKMLDQYQHLLEIIGIMEIILEHITYTYQIAPNRVAVCTILDIEIKNEELYIYYYDPITTQSFLLDSFPYDMNFTAIDYAKETLTNSTQQVDENIMKVFRIFSPGAMLVSDALEFISTIRGTSDNQREHMMFAFGSYLDAEGNVRIDTVKIAVMLSMFGKDISEDVFTNYNSFEEWSDEDYGDVEPNEYTGDVEKEVGKNTDDMTNIEYLLGCQNVYENET
jgi:hypothetical protein